MKGHLVDGSEVDIVDMLHHHFQQPKPQPPIDMRPGGLPPVGYTLAELFENRG